MPDYEYQQFKELQDQVRKEYVDKYNNPNISVQYNNGINDTIRYILKNYSLNRYREQGVFNVKPNERS